MKKKRLTKSEKATVAKIDDIQIRALQRLRTRTEVLIKTAEELLTKIDTKGIDNHYSMNNDVLRYAQEVLSTSYRLGELKAMRNDLVYDYGYIKKKDQKS